MAQERAIFPAWLLPSRRLVVAGAIVLLLVVLWQLVQLILLIFAAVLFAVLFRSLADLISRFTRLGDGPSLAVAVLLIAGFVVGLGWLLGAQLGEQMQELGERLPQAWRQIEDWIGQWGMTEAAWAWFADSSPDAQTLLNRVGAWLAMAATALTNLVIALVGGIYFAAQPGLYRRGFLRLVPPHKREQVGKGYDVLAAALRRWLLMQLAAMFAIGTITGLTLWAIGAPSPLALGVLAGLLEFIPVAGPIIAAIPALLVAITVGTEMLIYVLIAYLVIQQLEGNVITPMLARKVVSVPPALMLFALAGFGILFGPIGILLAAPLMVIVFVATREFYVEHLLEGEPLPEDAEAAAKK